MPSTSKQSLLNQVAQNKVIITIRAINCVCVNCNTSSCSN